MNRRSVLATTAFLFTCGNAGCLSDESADPQCHLMHEIGEPAEDDGQVAEVYRYEELSNEAQSVFEKTLSNGSYSTTNRSLQSAEFRYWDTTTTYTIIYQNETHVLVTYTGEGCETQ